MKDLIKFYAPKQVIFKKKKKQFIDSMCKSHTGKISFWAYNFIIQKITRSLNIFCKNKTEVFIKYCSS